MKIKASIERIPGGMMVIPLLLAASINTFFPNLLRIGGFTEALFVNGSGVLIGLYILIIGANLNVRQIGISVQKGLVLLVLKWAIGAAFGLIAFLLADSNGLFFGLVPLAIIAAMTNSNGGLYMALVGQYGKDDDKAAISILAFNDGPFLTMVALAIFGAMGFVDGLFPLSAFISVLLPLVIGMVLGNLDPEMKEFITEGGDKLIPFFAFALGMGISFKSIITGGLSGIMLGVATVIFTGMAAYYVFKLFKWNPLVGAAEGSTAGNAVATPAAIAAVNASYVGVAELATVQVAASTVTTAILLPILVAFLANRLEKKGELQDNKSEDLTMS